MKNDTSNVLWETLRSVNESDQNFEPANVVDGLFAIARGLESVARAIHALGFNDAATPMGTMEGLSVQVKEGLDAIGTAITCGLCDLTVTVIHEQQGQVKDK